MDSSATSAASRIQPVPILMYHQVAPDRIPGFQKYILSPRMFAMQMAWLAACGYRSITLDRLLAYRMGQASLPRRSVVITFDDGFQGCVDHAVPVLRRHRFSAIFYLVAGLMGDFSRWLLAEYNVAFPLMEWRTARDLLRHGLECGAHSLSHQRLATLDAASCQLELNESRALLERELARPIRHLAYPHGSFSPAVRELAANAGYLSACSVQIGLSAGEDVLALRRVPISGNEGMADFICRMRSGVSCRELLRAQLQAYAFRQKPRER